MMEILVGYTGFVGRNIAANHKFDMLCNSKNIHEAFGSSPDLLVYAGVPAEMFLANNNPTADREICENALNNIKRINPTRLVLISTISVIDSPVGVNEDIIIDESKLTTYGLNRLKLEYGAREAIHNCHIVRLPALFGKGIKKNFIYDMINFFPAMLNKAKFEEFSVKEPLIYNSYSLQDSGFYKLDMSADTHKMDLKHAFERVGFSALNFTDSRSVFQYYNLAYLWKHIEIAIMYEISILHMATSPISAGVLYEHIFNNPFINEITMTPFNYDFRTKYADVFSGKDGYIFGLEQVLSDIKGFVK